MEKINILVLGVGGNVGQGIITALKISEIPCKIIGACISADSLGLYMCDSSYISPYANDKYFIDWVIDLCNKENVLMIFSGVEEVIYILKLNLEILQAQTSALFISSSLEKLNIGNDKYNTVEWLKNNGLNYPQYANSEEIDSVKALVARCGFPLIGKPNKGKGSSGIIILKSIDDLRKVPKSNYIIQQYLGNEEQEYTVACYVDKNSVQQSLIIFRRNLMYGTTFSAVIVENELIKEECMKICSAFRPEGPLNIQLRIHNGIPICFELNVRFSGTTPIRARFGYNDVKAMVAEYLLNENVENYLKPAKKGRVYRYFNEFYVDTAMHNEMSNLKEIKNTSCFNNFHENQL